MLSIGKLGPGHEGCYLQAVARGVEDYYLGSGGAPGRWIGGGCGAFGLSERVGANADLELHLLLTLNEAQVHAKQGDVAGALIQLRGLAESPALSPGPAGSVYLALGSALQASGDPLGAVGAFRVAAESPDAEVAAGALFNTGNVLTAADELEAAEHAYRRAQHLYADCLDALGG